MEYTAIMTAQDAVDFGEMTVLAADSGGGLMDGVRGVTAGSASTVDSGKHIEFININTTSAGIDFGDLFAGRDMPQGAGDGNRGVIMQGFEPGLPGYGDTMDYITIGVNGNAVDFGEVHEARGRVSGHCSDGNRGIYSGGQNPGSYDTIGYFTISTTSSGTDFGEMTTARGYTSQVSSGYRGCFMGGNAPANNVDIINMWTIGTIGNGVDFGELLGAQYGTGTTSGG
jgi:hypothetical protein